VRGSGEPWARIILVVLHGGICQHASSKPGNGQHEPTPRSDPLDRGLVQPATTALIEQLQQPIDWENIYYRRGDGIAA
jgi:hypothetical protein